MSRSTAIGQADSKVNAALLAQGKIGDGCVTEQGVRNINQLLGKGANASAAEGDFFHYALHTIGQNPVAHLKGLVQNDDQAAKNIGQSILRRKGHGHGANTQGGDKAANVVIPFPSHGHKAQHDNNES